MRIVAESSAILAWLLEEAGYESVVASLDSADGVITSRLTLLECERTLVWGEKVGRLTAGDASNARAVLGRTAMHWTLIDVTQDVLDVARGPFPKEPVRSLDAVHLATAQFARRVEPALTMLSLDDRIRENATLLGFDVAP